MEAAKRKEREAKFGGEQAEEAKKLEDRAARFGSDLVAVDEMKGNKVKKHVLDMSLDDYKLNSKFNKKAIPHGKRLESGKKRVDDRGGDRRRMKSGFKKRHGPPHHRGNKDG